MASKTEVSRQLVCMLGGQSELDTDHQAAEDRLLWHQMVVNVVHVNGHVDVGLYS